MNFILIIAITLGTAGSETKNFELRIPQQSQKECEKAAKTFTFALPALSVITRCEPSTGKQEPEVRGV
jgi:hypothetical protein